MTWNIAITGVVQGVGMRPFVALLARRLGIGGAVRNIGSNVEITATGNPDCLASFLAALQAEKPAMSYIEYIETKEIPEIPYEDFEIEQSSGGAVDMLPADFPVCPDCLRELYDPANRRFRHPFISCALCGPRYSIIERAPYDRRNTSMADFPMCLSCASEYTNPLDRRYHAQTISCHDCGPYLICEDGNSHKFLREEALCHTSDMLKNGGIAAIKGVGGYHLACSPQNDAAVQRLRQIKGRERKPFAVMFGSMEQLRLRCEASTREEELLLSPARPIVLLKTIGRPFAPAVSDTPMTGAFLPYTPLQALLLQYSGELIMTSANRSGQPEIYEDGEMLAMLREGGLDCMLYNARRIVTRLDDSVARIVAGQRQLTRRSRGYAPLPISVQNRANKNIVAFGSDLKSAFCLLRRNAAYMSQYFGDMEVREVYEAYIANYAHMKALFGLEPELAACDLHPAYHSSQLARSAGLPLVEVQHHHAHIASVMAEHGVNEPVIGVAFDGTGYGVDGCIWGGEFLVCHRGSFDRKAHMRYVALAGGDSVAIDARKAALCYLHAAGLEAKTAFDGSSLYLSALERKINTVNYSGMGRLFDAAASILGICQRNGYEGQCAILLESAAKQAEAEGLAPLMMDFDIGQTNGTMLIDTAPVITALAQAAQERANAGQAALGFHTAICRMTEKVCCAIREGSGINTVALSGGVFQNEFLLSHITALLQGREFRVFTNNAVPCNDGGLALGQAYVASWAAQEEK